MYKIVKNSHINKHIIVRYCSKSKSYSQTVLLPKTTFPLRLEGKKLTDRDNSLSKSASFLSVYNWQRENLQGPEFVLHDGPPYANGATHMGHAINKILKDVIARSHILDRRKVSYIPGWDCHGLPIELKAVADGKGLNPVQIRQKARNFAKSTIEKQKGSFLSWGVCGDWNNAYTTYSSKYIQNQIKQFYTLYEKKLVYRDVKPVYWSPSTRTALAEAELEYNDNHVSTAITLKLQLKNVPDVFSVDKTIYGLIWTTTPWTLPSNQAVCYNPKLSYSLVENSTNSECYLISTNLVNEVSNNLNTELKIIKSFAGDALKDISYVHPVYESVEKFLPGSHALDTKGTGLVHTAPAHGPDDFLLALNHNISIKCIVDEYGNYTKEAGAKLENLHVLSDGQNAVLDLVRDDIVHVEKFTHSYPYDWRTKKPVILRASKQWFIDTNAIKQRAIEVLDNVSILPKLNSEVHRNHFVKQLQKRPYWCISRQRCWGVPIPVFYDNNTEEPLISRDSIDHFCTLIDKNGADFWWNMKTEELLPTSTLKEYNLEINDVKKGTDILDIWFDSGMSWSSVLSGDKVADMYLEGVDQFTGWFQSSLLTSVAIRDKAPYKSIYVHGFVVDENGLKMSKSLGNVVNPTDILQGTKANKAYGVDTLRWWVACHANQDAITHISNNVLKASNDEVQKIRSVLRFSLSALGDYKEEKLEYSSLKLIDKYVLHLLAVYQKQVDEYISDYQFQKIGTAIINLLTNNISALYYTSIKDRLYCEPEDSLTRRSTQFVLHALFYIVTRSIAPIVPHLAEELYQHLPNKKQEFFFQTPKYIPESNWLSNDIENVFDFILEIKKEFNKKSGASTVNKRVILGLSDVKFNYLKNLVGSENLRDELLDIFQIAELDFKIVEVNEEYTVEMEETNLKSCPRCRRFSLSKDDDLCHRCNDVVDSLKNKVELAL